MNEKLNIVNSMDLNLILFDIKNLGYHYDGHGSNKSATKLIEFNLKITEKSFDENIMKFTNLISDAIKECFERLD